MPTLSGVLNGLKDLVTGPPVASVTTLEAPLVPPSESLPLKSEAVILHVYSISERVNRFSLMFGLGLYHTSVEIYGQEHSFIGHPFQFTGVVSTIPKTAAYIYQEGLNMGRTKMNKEEVSHCLKELGKLFTGSSYHLLHHNCNHFASEFVKRLCNGKPPTYINRAAHYMCCLPFLDTMFSVKMDSERFFVEVLYLTFNGDMHSVMTILDVNQSTNLSRHVSYIEASFDDHSIPKCFPYYPVIKSYNPFTPSQDVFELVKKNLCTNFIMNQSKTVYDLAFDLYEKVQSTRLDNTTLADHTVLLMPEVMIDPGASSSANHSIDIHRHLNQLQKRLIDTIGRSPSEHMLDNHEILRSRKDEF